MGSKDFNILNNKQTLLQNLKACGYNIEKKNGQYFIHIENICVPIYPHDDIFTLKNRFLDLKKQEIRKENNSRFDKEIKEGEEKVEEYSNLFDIWMAALKREGHNFVSFLSNNGVSNLSQLKNDKQKYEQGVEIQDAKYFASKMKNRALSMLISASNETVSACCHKIMYSC